MTDRLKGVWVAFEQDFREDDAESIIDAISCLRGVADVTPCLSGSDDWMNRQRIKTEIAEKFLALYRTLLGVEE